VQESSGTYKKHLQSWHHILIHTKNFSTTYAGLHQFVVASLVENYHAVALHSGDRDRPYEAGDFDDYKDNGPGMLNLLHAIERSDNDNYLVKESDQLRDKLVAELGRGKWQNNKAPPPDAWYACLPPFGCACQCQTCAPTSTHTPGCSRRMSSLAAAYPGVKTSPRHGLFCRFARPV
jgi:hypothetical protein